METDDGARGLGGSAPVGYVTGESVPGVIEALRSIAPYFEGVEIARLEPLLDRAKRQLGAMPAALAGLEMALWDLWGKRWNMPLWHHFGGALETITSDLTIPLVPPLEAGVLAEAAFGEGFQHLKIKVGCADGADADIARIEAIHRAAPAATIRLDANQAFEPEDAVAFTKRAVSIGALIEMLEQPVNKEDTAGLKYVRDQTDVPVYADEAARSVEEVRKLIAADAVDGINVKLMKSGISGALDIIALCRIHGIQLMLGCMLETGLGIAAAAQIAAGTGAFRLIDLDSHRLLAPVPGLHGGFAASGDSLSVSGGHSGGWNVKIS